MFITIKNDCCLIHKIRKFAAISLLKTSILENRGYIYIYIYILLS